ncbi:MAG: SHOCT domain-containing protein [Paracoccaceae bacterium]
MTAVLDEIRQLEAARSRGDMDEFAFRLAKAELMNAIEDADQALAEQADHAAPSRGTVWQVVLFALVAFVSLTGITAIVLGDTTLALTVAVVVLAAITIQAFRTLED